MNIYQDYCLPRLIDCACSIKLVKELRQQVVPLAKGRVLEVGMGSGLNLPFYNSELVTKVWGLEPSATMRHLAANNIKQAGFEFELLDLPGEEIPLDDNEVDTVLLTFTLCTIPDWSKALQQMRRVLKPGGQLVFCEHGLSPDANVQKWQNRINPIWKKLAGGCHLNRPIPEYLQQAGFNIGQIQQGYLTKAPKFAGYLYRGVANIDEK